jgi:LysR family pca operon transcriptional activator
MLLDDEIDLVVGHMPALDQMVGLTFEHLYVEPFVFVVRNGHPLADARPCDVSTLKQFEMVLPQNSPSDNAHVARLLTAIGLTDDITDRVVAMAPAFVREFLLQTNAICVVPEGTFIRELRTGELVALAIDTSHSLGPVGIILKEDVEFRPPIEVMTRAFHAAAKTRQTPGRWTLRD